MSVIHSALKKATLARRGEEPAQVLFETSMIAETARESVSSKSQPAMHLFPILLASASLLLAGYSAYLYQSKQTEQGLRAVAETRYAEQSALLGQTTEELATTKTDLEELNLQNATLQKTIVAQGEVIVASASGQARLTDKLRTLFKAFFASRSKMRQFSKESASKENTIALLVGELSKTKETAVA